MVTVVSVYTTFPVPFLAARVPIWLHVAPPLVERSTTKSVSLVA